MRSIMHSRNKDTKDATHSIHKWTFPMYNPPLWICDTAILRDHPLGCLRTSSIISQLAWITQPIFGVIFLHVKARKLRQNRFCHKIDFATKQRKWQQNVFRDKTEKMVTEQIGLHISHVGSSVHMTNFSPHFRTCQIFLHIYHVEILLQLTTFHVEKFLDGRFFSTGTTCGACDKYQVCTWVATLHQIVLLSSSFS